MNFFFAVFGQGVTVRARLGCVRVHSATQSTRYEAESYQ